MISTVTAAPSDSTSSAKGRVGGRHAGRRLVQQQQPGRGGQGEGDLELAALPVRQGRRRDRRPAGQPDQLELAHRRLAGGRVPAGRAQHGHAETGRPPGGKGDVVEHGQGGEQAGVLEGLGHPGPGPGVVGPAGDVLAVEADPARGRAQAPGDQREQGRLAGAVGADDGVPGPGGDRQRDLVEGHQRPVAPGQPLGL
jgi:hypothetical protein